jgi:hypothetical protein
MKYRIALGLILIMQFTCLAQYKNNKWLLGYEYITTWPWGGSKIEFQGNTRNISIDPRSMWFHSNYSGLSDVDDNWFVYTNGSAVCNSNHDTLINGNGLSPGGDNYWIVDGMPVPAHTILFPRDTVQNQCYLFHSNAILHAPGFQLSNRPRTLQLYYSIIDPLAAGGRGAVISKNNLVINDTLEVGNILTVRHANGRDWWVVAKRFYADIFYAVLVTPDSVYTPIAYSTQSPVFYLGGQTCFSPDGKYFATFANTLSQLRIFDFDRCTGVLGNYRGKFISNNLGGDVSFSPNSRFLYISTVDTLWQFDMQATDVLASQTFIAQYDGYTDSLNNATIFFWHWLARDGKIYITSNVTSRKLHVINNPDMPGQACNFQQHSVSIPTYNAYTIPTPINLALYQEVGSICDSLDIGNAELKILETELTIAPNPSDGKFSIEYTPQRQSGSLYIYDVSGKAVYREYVSPYSSIKNLDLSNMLTNGMYAVRLVWGIAGQTRNDGKGKIIIQKH